MELDYLTTQAGGRRGDASRVFSRCSRRRMRFGIFERQRAARHLERHGVIPLAMLVVFRQFLAAPERGRGFSTAARSV